MKLSFAFKSFLTYLACTAADFVSSIGRFPEGFHEANPFARHLDGSFWPLHALGSCAIDTAEYLLLSAGLYFCVAYVSKRAATWLSALPWLWYGWGHLDAAFQNLQVKLFFVPFEEPSKFFDMLLRMLGIN